MIISMNKQLLVIATVFLSLVNFTFGQSIENGDFEDIQSITRLNPNNDPFTYDSIGAYWVTGDEIKRDIALTPDPGPFCKDTSWAYSGNHALLMRTMDLQGIIGTGNAGIGVYEYDDMNPFNSVKIGTPFTYRPAKLQGYYAYESIAGDSCWIALFFSKWNSATSQRDTIAYSEFVTNQSTGFSSFTQFELPINFLTSDFPDTMGILMCSSKGGYEAFPPVGQPGTTLIVDSLTFVYTSQAEINEISKVDFIEIQQHEDFINFFVTKEFKGTIQITDLSGKLMDTLIIKDGDNKYFPKKKNTFYIARIQGTNVNLQSKFIF